MLQSTNCTTNSFALGKYVITACHSNSFLEQQIMAIVKLNQRDIGPMLHVWLHEFQKNLSEHVGSNTLKTKMNYTVFWTSSYTARQILSFNSIFPSGMWDITHGINWCIVSAMPSDLSFSTWSITSALNFFFPEHFVCIALQTTSIKTRVRFCISGLHNTGYVLKQQGKGWQ